MPPRNRQPGPNQIPLPGQEELPALVHILTPEYLGIRAEEYDDITPDMIKWATAEHFRPALINPQTDRPNTATYKPAGEPGYARIALTPEEFIMIPHSLAMLGNRAYSGTLKARPQRAHFSADVAAAERARVHAAESKLAKMQPYFDNVLSHRVEVTEKFIEMTQYPNLNRGNRETVRMRFNGLQLHVLGDMFTAIRVQKDWTEEQADLALRSFVKRIALDPVASRRPANLREILGLAHEYYGHKRALFATKIWETKKFIRDNQQSE